MTFSSISLILILFTISSVFDETPNNVIPSRSDGHYHHINGNRLNSRLDEANHRMEVLFTHNRELVEDLEILSRLRRKGPTLSTDDNFIIQKSLLSNPMPSSEYEKSLRRLAQNTDEIWHFLRGKLDSKSKQFVEELRYNMIYDLNTLRQRDAIRGTEQLNQLGEYVQNRIKRMQNPDDCSKVKKLVCDLNRECGLGCQIHHWSLCLIAAMAFNRTLIANTNEWRTNSADHNVWNKVFQPLSESCVDGEGYNETHWKSGDLSSYQVIVFPIIDFIDPIPDFMPPVIPQQISEPIQRLCGEPFIWLMGQVVKYLLRPSDRMSDYISELKVRINFKHPIVGIHVRRTDKIGTEAQFHSIDEYMYFVDDFYNRLDLERERNSIKGKSERRVYLATDEPDVWRTEIMPYKQKGYIFAGDSKLSQSANPSQRSSFDSLHAIVVDLMLLSQTDHIVCTFSSQVCRRAFELMQTRLSAQDMSSAYYSLDDAYYFGGQVCDV